MNDARRYWLFECSGADSLFKASEEVGRDGMKRAKTSLVPLTESISDPGVASLALFAATAGLPALFLLCDTHGKIV